MVQHGGEVLIVQRRPRHLLWLSGKVSVLKVGGPRFTSSFPWLDHTSDFKIGTLVATKPGTYHHGVSTRTGLLSVSLL